ncbi:MAG: chemotaxis-specific protein-glutamate methyltransferase CheB [Gammaproteobacteria bacterium]|nr:chemotaxis-specific protein-glutamate methyltransferase CheB [Gammaproteobacteria bacterium]
MIRILIADDSDVALIIISSILESQDDFEVVGTATNGEEAVNLNNDLKPDLITMDIRMPIMDGFDATRMIMSTNPTPIVIVSSYLKTDESRITFRALEEGALAVLEKPANIQQPNFENVCQDLIQVVRAMAEVKLVRRTHSKVTKDIIKPRVKRKISHKDIVALVCSTGGPQAIVEIVSSLPPNYPLPIVIVQHISPGFILGLVHWLRGHTMLEVKLAQHDELIEPGCIYLAPDDYHLKIAKVETKLYAQLVQTEPVGRFRPSGTVLLKSLSHSCGSSTIAGILTGMGNDGAEGMIGLHKKGSITFVQNEESCIVFGMPAAALSNKCVDDILPLQEIAGYLNDHAGI